MTRTDTLIYWVITLDTFETKLLMLAGILAEKESALTRILKITEKQSMRGDKRSAVSHVEANAASVEINSEKQRLIEKVLDADRVFERVFGEISGEFEQRASQFADTVRRLQDAIGRAASLDARIRLEEEAGRRVLSKSNHRNASAPRASKLEVLREYAKNSKKTK